MPKNNMNIYAHGTLHLKGTPKMGVPLNSRVPSFTANIFYDQHGP